MNFLGRAMLELMGSLIFLNIAVDHALISQIVSSIEKKEVGLLQIKLYHLIFAALLGIFTHDQTHLPTIK